MPVVRTREKWESLASFNVESTDLYGDTSLIKVLSVEMGNLIQKHVLLYSGVVTNEAAKFYLRNLYCDLLWRCFVVIQVALKPTAKHRYPQLPPPKTSVWIAVLLFLWHGSEDNLFSGVIRKDKNKLFAWGSHYSEHLDCLLGYEIL
jgi:hypothetical protein